jgi:very-short-patch-repair endonuclease
VGWLALGGRGVAFRRTAGAIWGLDAVDRGTIEFAACKDRWPRARDVQVTRLGDLRPDDVSKVEGWPPVTAVPRTLADLGAVLAPDAVERALESALRRRLASATGLRSVTDRPNWQRGLPVLREILRRRPEDAPATESDAETRFLQLCRRAGIEDPVRQHPLILDGQRIRLDFAWVRQRVAAEIDGAAAHAGDALGPDLRRQNRIVLGDWTVIRFTWDDVVHYPDYTLSVVREAHRLGLPLRLEGTRRRRAQSR